MITLTWQEYAEWLVAVNGMDVEDAIVRAERLYTKQYKNVISDEDKKQFYDDRAKVREI